MLIMVVILIKINPIQYIKSIVEIKMWCAFVHACFYFHLLRKLLKIIFTSREFQNEKESIP